MEVRPAEAIALPVPRPAVLAQDLVWPLLVALATAAAIAPFWASELLPYQDGPQHVAAVRVLADYHSPGFAFDRWFELDLGRLQYLGFYLPAAAIAKVTGPDAAVRIMLSLIAVAASAACLPSLPQSRGGGWPGRSRPTCLPSCCSAPGPCRRWPRGTVPARRRGRRRTGWGSSTRSSICSATATYWRGPGTNASCWRWWRCSAR